MTSLLSRVIESQGQDKEILSIRDLVRLDIGDEGWVIHTDGSLRYRGRVVVPQLENLREEILKEFQCSLFAVNSCHGRVIRNQQNLYPIFLILP